MKFIQITAGEGYLFGLTAEGEVWFNDNVRAGWKKVEMEQAVIKNSVEDIPF